MGEGVELPKTELPKTKLPKTERSNILIWLIKLVLIGIIIAAVIYLINSLLPDNNNQELNCGDPNQDGSNRIYVCPSGKTLKLPPNDNLCTGDTCTDTDCCVDIPSVDSSSVRVCQRPSSSVLNNYNMTNVQENDLNMDSFDVTGITCNTGYSGTAVATVCTRPGGHYTVSGCTSSTGGTPTGECIRPLDTTGYNNIVETSLSMGSFEVSAGCAVGYTGTATTRVCDVANGAYTLDGCSVDGCYDPTISGLRNCGTNAVCEDNDPPDPSYICRCAPGYTGPSRHGGRIDCLPIQDNIDHPRTCADTDADGSMNNFDCTGSPNSLDLSPADIDCSDDACTAAECCTVQNISEPPYYLGDNLESCTATCARYGKTCEASGWEYNPNIYGDDASRSGATTDNILPASFLSQLNCNTYRNESSKGTPYIIINTDSDDITCNYLNSGGRRGREGGRYTDEELCLYVQDAWETNIEKRICKCV